MNTLIHPKRNEFTNDHRTNYQNYNKSDIFNKTVVIKENQLVNVKINFYFLIKKEFQK